MEGVPAHDGDAWGIVAHGSREHFSGLSAQIEAGPAQEQNAGLFT